MNEKPERRGSAARGQTLAAQYSKLLAPMAEQVAMAQRFASQLGPLAEQAVAAQRFAAQLAPMAEQVAMAQRFASQLGPLAEQAVAAQRFAAQLAPMAEQVAMAQRFASQLGPLAEQAVAAQRFAAQLAPMVAEHSAAQRLAVQMAPITAQLVTMQRFASQLGPWMGQVVAAQRLVEQVHAERIVGMLPHTVHSPALSAMLRPLLETPEYKKFGPAAVELSQWAAERLSGAETASPERFAEIANRFDGVELDKESEQQLEQLAEDEGALRAFLASWGIEKFLPKTRANIMTARALMGYAAFLLLVVGLLGNPVLTGIILTSLGGAWKVQKETGVFLIKYSPEARSQIDSMGPTDPEADGTSANQERS
ncbi:MULTISPECIES: hypothetical protein [unclassified Arthrobacter]|uniref:hypothetical protein n=1 Tax=unclassified Arthrobacter TaxID=235627 RepID=UPI000CE3A65E|nr:MULTISPECIES: hypothetical protein [unclassified Arthrobacter]